MQVRGSMITVNRAARPIVPAMRKSVRRSRATPCRPQFQFQPRLVLVKEPPTFIEEQLVPGLPVLIDHPSGNPAAARWPMPADLPHAQACYRRHRSAALAVPTPTSRPMLNKVSRVLASKSFRISGR